MTSSVAVYFPAANTRRADAHWPGWATVAGVFVASGLCWGAVVFFALTIAALMHGAGS